MVGDKGRDEGKNRETERGAEIREREKCRDSVKMLDFSILRLLRAR